MGIIILPFLLAALAVSVVAIIRVIGQIKSKEIGIKEILLGFIISASIFGLISLSYIIEGRAWGLSPAFRIPTFMVFVPFGIHLAANTSTIRK